MFIRLWAVFLVFMFLTGCAVRTQESGVQIQQLQNRINCLEEELQRKNQDIACLEGKVESLYDNRMSSDKPADSYANMSVKQIQTALKNAGFYKGVVDGKIGPKTKDAIIAFQKANSLKADGVVGKKTWAKLAQHL